MERRPGTLPKAPTDVAPAGPPIPREPASLQSPEQPVVPMQPAQEPSAQTPAQPRLLPTAAAASVTGQPQLWEQPQQPLDEDLFVQLPPKDGVAGHSNGSALAGAPAPADARDAWLATNRVRLSEQQRLESEMKRKTRERAAEMLQQIAQARAAKKEERHRRIVTEAQACSQSIKASQGLSGVGGREGWLKVTELLRDPATGSVTQTVNAEGTACPLGVGIEAAPSVEATGTDQNAPAAVKDVGRMRDVLVSLSREQQQNG